MAPYRRRGKRQRTKIEPDRRPAASVGHGSHATTGGIDASGASNGRGGRTPRGVRAVHAKPPGSRVPPGRPDSARPIRSRGRRVTSPGLLLDSLVAGAIVRLAIYRGSY